MKQKNFYVGIPAYNCQNTISDVIKRCKKQNPKEIIVVNDGSKDKTLDVLKNEEVILINHKSNRGYGGAQKTIYSKFLEISKDEEEIIILIHSDGQTLPEEIPNFLEEFKKGKRDVVLGSRKLGNPKSGGMPTYRIIGDDILTKAQNFCFNLKLSTYASGYRAFKRKVLQKLDLKSLPDNHKIDTEILLAIKDHGFELNEIPVKTLYDGEKSHYNLIRYSIEVLLLGLKYKMGYKLIKKEQSPDYYHKLYYSKGIHSHINRERIDSVVKYIKKGSSVLDAGCGSGVLSCFIEGDYHGVELNKNIINYARRKTNGEYYCQDLRKLNLSRKFDTVVCSHTLEHFVEKDRIKVLENLDKHLKKGGLMILAVPSIFFMNVIEKPFQIFRRVVNPNIKFDDEEIHEKVDLIEEVSNMRSNYEIVESGNNCLLTNSFIVLKKYE